MASHYRGGQPLRATLCEIERGLFHIAYYPAGTAASHHLLPLYEVGTCARDARMRVEQRARECGFSAIIWDHAAPNMLYSTQDSPPSLVV